LIELYFINPIAIGKGNYSINKYREGNTVDILLVVGGAHFVEIEIHMVLIRPSDGVE